MLFEDADVADFVRAKFQRLSETPLVVDNDMLCSQEKGQQDSPFPFPHADLDVYARKAYVGGSSGIAVGSIGGATKYPVTTRAERTWDAPVLRVAAGWDSLAVAAGDEGLFEAQLFSANSLASKKTPLFSDPIQISASSCVDCSWAYWSIFASSPAGGFLATFRTEESYNNRLLHSDQSHEYAVNPERQFERIVTSEEMWGETGYTWGVGDKLCLAVCDVIKVIQYTPGNPEMIRPVGEVDVGPRGTDVVSASATPFGIVVELDDAIVVHTSSGETVELEGEPSNWRVFPKARHYANQLHVVRENCLEIYSFNHDYLVDQQQKVAGLRVT